MPHVVHDEKWRVSHASAWAPGLRGTALSPPSNHRTMVFKTHSTHTHAPEKIPAAQPDHRDDQGSASGHLQPPSPTGLLYGINGENENASFVPFLLY